MVRPLGIKHQSAGGAVQARRSLVKQFSKIHVAPAGLSEPIGGPTSVNDSHGTLRDWADNWSFVSDACNSCFLARHGRRKSLHVARTRHFPAQAWGTDAMNKALMKPMIALPRMPKRPSTTIASTTYRVSKAQSLRMRAFDKRAEAADAKKAKAAETKKAKADKKAGLDRRS